MLPVGNKPQGGFVIFITALAGLILMIVPLPDWLETARPQWLIMVLIYWCLALPGRVGVFVGWWMGLFLDVASGSLLGQNAMSFSIVSYLAIKLHQRIRVFPLWQQAMSVLVLVALHQMITLWIKGIIGHSSQDWSYWMPSVSSMLLWPLVFTLLRNVRRFYRVR
jgi:rod shape-determining protein MreD